MDIKIAEWEMNLGSDFDSDSGEVIASWPSEPYNIGRDEINPN